MAFFNNPFHPIHLRLNRPAPGKSIISHRGSLLPAFVQNYRGGLGHIQTFNLLVRFSTCK